MNIPVEFIAESIVDMPSPARTRVIIKEYETNMHNNEMTMKRTRARLAQAMNIGLKRFKA